jgi:multiple sugar transport system substrate-binding protein
MPGPQGPGASSAGGGSLVIFRTSKVKEEAWLFAQYLSRPDVQARFYDLTGNMPPRRATWAIPALAQSPYARAFWEQLTRVRSPPKVPEWERIATEIRITAERLVRGRVNVEEAVAELDRKADAILEKRRWMLDRRRST